MKRSTQVDVARITGVSRASVSYALTGQTNGRVTVSSEKKHRVLDAVAELGHEPDVQAYARHSSSTGTIGSFFADIHIAHLWQQQYIEGIDISAHVLGNRLFVPGALLNPKQEKENRTTLFKQRWPMNIIHY